MKTRSVLVTGAHGYLGSVLIGELDRRGYRTTGLDSGIMSFPRIPLRHGHYVDADLRQDIEWESLLAGVDAVIHLAAIVGDPACNVDADLAWDTNYVATAYLIDACRRHGVREFLFASTCSSYGQSFGEAAGLHTPLYPQSLYAESKIYSEHHLLANADERFRPRILRLSTLYGLSPRMRFDLVVNVMTAHAVNRGEILVNGGTQWRPLLHVQDAAQAFIRALEVPHSTAFSVWNCGSALQNHRIIDIAETVASVIPGTTIVRREADVDHRDYVVDFTGIQTDLGFAPDRELATEVLKIAEAIGEGKFGSCAEAEYNNYETLLRGGGLWAKSAIRRPRVQTRASRRIAL